MAAGVMRVLLLLIVGAADPRPPSVRVEIMVRFCGVFLLFFSADILFFVAFVSGELSIEFYELSVSCASHFAVPSLYPCKHPS